MLTRILVYRKYICPNVAFVHPDLTPWIATISDFLIANIPMTSVEHLLTPLCLYTFGTVIAEAVAYSMHCSAARACFESD